MSKALWQSTVSLVGPDAGDMIDAGVLILFGEPVPEALAEVSVVHSGFTAPTRPIAGGDQFEFAGQVYTVDEVGERAVANLTELGHIVLYANQPEQELLPGAVKVSGPDFTAPAVGSQVSFLGS